MLNLCAYFYYNRNNSNNVVNPIIYDCNNNNNVVNLIIYVRKNNNK